MCESGERGEGESKSETERERGSGRARERERLRWRVRETERVCERRNVRKRKPSERGSEHVSRKQWVSERESGTNMFSPCAS
jgi:hypothetical protein